MRRSMSWIYRHLWLALLLFLTISETLIVQWAALALRGSPLPLLGLLLCAVGIAAANLGLILLPRFRRGSRRRHRFALNRALMMTSLGAMLSGPLLAGAFVLAGVAALGLEPLLQRPLGTELLVAAGGAALALGFGAILWGWAIGQHRVKVERVDLPVRGLSPALGGVRLVHITDVHIGPQLRGARLRGLLQRVNELDPDLVVITGDIFDYDPAYIEEGGAELAFLRARHGVYAVLGNHDVYTGAAAVARGLRQHTEIQVLRNEWARVELRGNSLLLLGIDDPGRQFGRDLESPALQRLADEAPADAPRLVLMHRPGYFGQVARLGLPVALAGHTHGGQVSLPAPAQHHNVSRLITDFTRGLFRLDDAVLYVSRGLGVAGPPIRINCPREITLHRLHPVRAG